MVPDNETSTEIFANSSDSSLVCASDENSMRCDDYVLQNCMKSVFSLCADDFCLQKIVHDFKYVQRIMEDSKCSVETKASRLVVL